MRELLLFLNIFLELWDDLLMIINCVKLYLLKNIYSIYRVKFIELWIYGLLSYFIGNRFSVFRVNNDGYILKN